jgi:drug/metabolite transporter (DMT)-like permease
MSSAASHRLHLIIAFATIYVLWGSTYIGIRVAVETLPPFAMAASRFAVAGAALYAFLRLRGVPPPTLRQWRDGAAVGLFLLLGGNGGLAWAEQYVPSGIAALIVGACPLFMVLTDWIWPGGTRPTASVLVAMGIGLCGVAWLVSPWDLRGETAVHPGGVIVILLGSLSWAVGSIYSRRHKSGGDVFLASAVQMLCGSVALALAGVLHGDFAQLDLSAVSTRSWIALIYLTIFGSLIGFSTFVWLLKHSTPARVATYAYVNPVVAVFLGWAMLDEQVTTRTLIASAIIIGAVAMITTRQTKSAGGSVPAGPKSSANA